MRFEEAPKPGFEAHEPLQCRTEPPRTILLVNPDPCLCQLNAERLQRHGYSVNTATDAETAWTDLQSQHYNLLITDNNLPGVTGVGLLKKLRSACMPICVIMIIETVPSWRSAQYPWLLKATKLLKPYSFEDLLGVVKRFLPALLRIEERPAPRRTPNCQFARTPSRQYRG